LNSATFEEGHADAEARRAHLGGEDVWIWRESGWWRIDRNWIGGGLTRGAWIWMR
jgi:hypothetical protein